MHQRYICHNAFINYTLYIDQDLHIRILETYEAYWSKFLSGKWGRKITKQMSIYSLVCPDKSNHQKQNRWNIHNPKNDMVDQDSVIILSTSLPIWVSILHMIVIFIWVAIQSWIIIIYYLLVFCFDIECNIRWISLKSTCHEVSVNPVMLGPGFLLQPG